MRSVRSRLTAVISTGPTAARTGPTRSAARISTAATSARPSSAVPTTHVGSPSTQRTSTGATGAGGNTIGRANLDGSGVNQNFITGANDPFGVAVDGGHVYWANLGSGTIGRANIDGSGVNQSFITGASNPYGVAVDGAHVYWTNNATGIRSAAQTLTEVGVKQNFITGAGAHPASASRSTTATSTGGPGATTTSPASGARTSRAAASTRTSYPATTSAHVASRSTPSGPGPPPPSNDFTIVPRVTCAGVCHVILDQDHLRQQRKGDRRAGPSGTATGGPSSGCGSKKPRRMIRKLRRVRQVPGRIRSG